VVFNNLLDFCTAYYLILPGGFFIVFFFYLSDIFMWYFLFIFSWNHNYTVNNNNNNSDDDHGDVIKRRGRKCMVLNKAHQHRPLDNSGDSSWTREVSTLQLLCKYLWLGENQPPCRSTPCHGC
jgi:hypothetical protein